MNIDDGFVVELRNALTTVKTAELRECLRKAHIDQFAGFCRKISTPVSLYRAHKSGRKTIPGAGEQQKYRKKLDTRLRKVEAQCAELIDLLEQAPFALRKAARSAKFDVAKVQRDLVSMLQALQKVSASKRTVEPELDLAVQAIARAFEDTFGIAPVVRAVTDDGTIGPYAPLEDQFVSAVAILLDLSPNYAYRVSKQILSP